MSGSIIIRHGYTIDDAGRIHYHEAPASWEQADALAGRRVDRRRSYAIIDGSLTELVHWSQPCTGCFEAPEYTSYDMETTKGHGCRECGFTGRVRCGAFIECEIIEAGRQS
ncbi:hypothetical protein [Ancylobacter radicis]|uniref:Uncharacterized protein n=1 Tax=Ancylobacter radicis TaxID=2836179 RepID=A0ABS5R5Q4_9HYPH|nr:hypothetical protein [Ancylobacter radicis]MBS9476221.1 hypothetical protein [Ancylobacter radicis]